MSQEEYERALDLMSHVILCTDLQSHLHQINDMKAMVASKSIKSFENVIFTIKKINFQQANEGEGGGLRDRNHPALRCRNPDPALGMV